MVDSQVQKWIDYATAELDRSPEFFVSAHADEISGGGILSQIEIFDLFSTVTRGVPSAQTRLALPYGYSPGIDTNLPDLALPEVGTSDEPPSVYLFAAGSFSLPGDREEYRCPYTRTPWDDSYAAEYVCSRSMQDRAFGWEFSRTVWVRHIASSRRIDVQGDSSAG